MKIYDNIQQLIGGTPLVAIDNIQKALNLKARILVKIEAFNPSGSVKDRAAFGMLQQGIQEGKITADTVIIEPTSGNTGIGLAAIGASMGLRVILVMPETMSYERRYLLSAYGAEIVLTDGKLGMKGAIAKAEALRDETVNALILSQFVNKANPQIHYTTTGPEIYEDTDGCVDVFVAGIGTGGTITGAGRYLKEQKATIEVIGVEPDASAILSGEKPGPHKIQGIGAGFIPEVLDKNVYDRLERVRDEDAIATARMLAQKEGILVGFSSGAAVFAAITLAQDAAYAGKTIVAILPDTGDRYLSTALFKDEKGV